MQGPVAINVYRGNDIYSTLRPENDDIYFRKRDVGEVRLSHIDEAAWQFWQSYSNQYNFANNMFFPYNRNLQSNISSGKGYWCGYGSRTRTIVVR